MTTATVPAFEVTLQKTNIWLKDLLAELDWHETDYQRAYHALRAVLRTLRDCLMVEEAADLAAQLPMLIRGFYYEGWSPAHVPSRERNAKEFLSRIADECAGERSFDAKEVTRAVFRVLAKHVSPGELDDVRRCLPESIRELWRSHR